MAAKPKGQIFYHWKPTTLGLWLVGFRSKKHAHIWEGQDKKWHGVRLCDDQGRPFWDDNPGGPFDTEQEARLHFEAMVKK